MSIYEYNEGDHAGKFQGIRVVCKVGDDYRQKYFPFRTRIKGKYVYISLKEEQKIRRDAKALDEKWNKERLKLSRKKVISAKRKRSAEMPQNTGVSGISAIFIVDKKFRGGEIRTYYTPAFSVHGSQDKKRFIKSFRISKMTFEEAWMAAVKFYAKNKKIGNYKHLISRKPNIDIFKRVRTHMRKLGHCIPISLLRRIEEKLKWIRQIN